MRVNFMAPGTTSVIVTYLPLIPRVGEQILLNDFITDESLELEIRSKGVNPDALFVDSVTWMKSEGEASVSIFLKI